MKNFWFRMCFEKEFEDEREADDFFTNDVLAEINSFDVKKLGTDMEERNG